MREREEGDQARGGGCRVGERELRGTEGRGGEGGEGRGGEGEGRRRGGEQRCGEGCVKGFGKKEMGLKENRAIQGSRLSHLCSGRRELEGGGGRENGKEDLALPHIQCLV